MLSEKSQIVLSGDQSNINATYLRRILALVFGQQQMKMFMNELLKRKQVKIKDIEA